MDAGEQWHTLDPRTAVLATGDGGPTPPAELSLDATTTNDHWAAVVPPADLTSGDEVSLEWGRLNTGAGSGETRVVDVATTTPELLTLHAWVHRENPEGVFHGTHPEVAGGGADHR